MSRRGLQRIGGRLAMSSHQPADVAERDSDIGDGTEPTPQQRERFIDDWLEKKAKRDGVDFIFEAIAELGDIYRISIFMQFMNGSVEAFGEAVKDAIRAYWLPMAEEACDAHDFSEDAL